MTSLAVELAAWQNELRDPHSGEWAKSLRSMSPAEKRAYVKSGTLPARLATGAVPAPAAVPEPRAVPAPPTGGKLSGQELWMSGEGVVQDTTPAERKAAKAAWYRDTFSYTNDYLRHGMAPSASAAAAKKAHLATGSNYGLSRLDLPVDSDAEYIAAIKATQAMMERAPAFSRPAVMYRDVTSPDQVFGPAGSMKGRVFTDHGFMSTTTDMHTAEQYGGDSGPSDKIVINVPAGGRAMRSSLEFSSDHSREKEYTFPPGSRFRVDEDKITNGQRQTVVTLIVPPGTPPGPKPTPVVPRIAVREPFQAYPGQRYNVETGELV